MAALHNSPSSSSSGYSSSDADEREGYRNNAGYPAAAAAARPPERRFSRGPFSTETFQGYVFISARANQPFRTVTVTPVAPPPPPPPVPVPPAAADTTGNTTAPPPAAPVDEPETDDVLLSRKPLVPPPIESRLIYYQQRHAQVLLIPCLGRGAWNVVVEIARAALQEGFVTGTSSMVEFEFELVVLDGPFRGADYSASCIGGRHYTVFTSDIYFFNTTFSRIPLEWVFLRYSVANMPVSAWGFFLRHGQTMFPKTDKETSEATQPPMLLSPCPYERFCLDLRPTDPSRPLDYFLYNGYVRNGITEAAEAALKSKARSRFAKEKAARLKRCQECRITINRDFRRTLLRMREYHKAKPNGTWFESEYCEFLATLQATNALNRLSSSRSSLSHVPVHLMVFELWDNATDELLASTYGFQVGSAFHDCSMATFSRDRAVLYGSLLSHAVADMLQRAGVELWYWGKELPYMTDYRRTARGFTVPSREFFPMWIAAAGRVPSGGPSVAEYFNRRYATHNPHFSLAPPFVRRLSPPPKRLETECTELIAQPVVPQPPAEPSRRSEDGSSEQQPHQHLSEHLFPPMEAAYVTRVVPLTVVEDQETAVVVACAVGFLLPTRPSSSSPGLAQLESVD